MSDTSPPRRRQRRCVIMRVSLTNDIMSDIGHEGNAYIVIAVDAPRQPILFAALSKGSALEFAYDCGFVVAEIEDVYTSIDGTWRMRP